MTDPTAMISGTPLDAPPGYDELLDTAQRALAQAERARLRAEISERRFHTLADVLPQLIWACDIDGSVTYFNRRWLEYPRIERPREGCTDWVEALTPEDRKGIDSVWRERLSDHAPLEVQARLRTRLGVDRWHLIRATPTVGPGGSHLGWTGTCTDVDDQHRVQEELVRTGEFREQLIGIIGHDLRAPLSAIAITAIKLIAQAGAADSADLARIHRSAGRMGRMIEQLLDFTRGRIGGGIQIRRTRGSVRDVCRNLVAEFEAAHPLRVFRVDAPEPTVELFDHDRIAQVFSNLIANALQHGTAHTPIDIEIRESARSWSLSVLSHGNPIPACELSLLFEPFRRSRAPVDGPVSTGLGLGLYIVDQAVRAHGGALAVTSDAEAGTRFTATFPAQLAVGEAPDAAAPADLVLDTMRARGYAGLAARVLLIDDGADAAEVLLTLLARRGHSVVLVGTGAAGLEEARRMTPDVVVCDIGLPDMTGYDVAHLLRVGPATASAYLVALTGFSRREAETRALAAGFDVLVTKPVDVDELEALLRRGSDRGAARGTA